ncbi:MAG TPA: biopolymer transporter ExbD [Phycisphaeraceae bacterium]
MIPIRRHDLSPRVELLPLLDVVFLLLTFFIYSLVMMVRAEVLPVRLVPVNTGERVQQPADLAAITIDQAGRCYLNRELIEPADLDERLAQLALRAPPPKLFIALEQAGPGQEMVDRGPVLIDLVSRIRKAGIEDFAIVGEPQGRQPTGEAREPPQ